MPGKTRELNAIVNALVPRDVTCASRMDLTAPMALKTYQRTMETRSYTKRAAGLTH